MQQIGLTKEEACITTVLLSTSEATANELFETTRIPKSRIYYVLESLERLGVIFAELGSPKIYRLLNPVDAFDNLRTLLTAKYEKKILLIDKLTDWFSSSSKNLNEVQIRNYPLYEKNLLYNQFRQFIDEASYSIKLKEIYKDVQDQFRTVFSESIIGLKLFNPNEELLETNKAWFNILGIDPKKEKKGNSLENELNLTEDILRGIRRGEKVKFNSMFDLEDVSNKGIYNNEKKGFIPLKYSIIPLFLDSEDELKGYLVQIQDTSNPEKDKKFDDILKIKQLNTVLFKWLKKLNCPSCMPEIEHQFDKVFTEIANSIKTETDDPDSMNIKINIGGEFYYSDNFTETSVAFEEKIIVKNEKRGCIYFFNINCVPVSDKDRNLLEMVSRLIGDFLLLQDKLKK